MLDHPAMGRLDPTVADAVSVSATVRPVLPTAHSIITAGSRWFDWRLRQLWRYRDLVMLFVWRDFVSVYKQTVLGPTWHIIRPLTTSGIFTIVFGSMARLSTDGNPPFLFYMAGTITWSYFAVCLEQTAKTFVGNAYLLGKVYFHRLVIPVSLVISNLISFAIQFALFGAALLVYLWFGANVHVTIWSLLLPLLVLMLAGYGLAGGVIVCALTTRYRDLAYAVAFATQLLMYVTPVIYPRSAVPVRFQWLVAVNPLTPIIEAFRLGFLGVGTVNLTQLACSFGALLYCWPRV